MRVLVACEFSGVVRDAFASRGHEAWSCDLLPTETRTADFPGGGTSQHYTGDIFSLLPKYEWDLMIAHPPCTYLSSSGLHWNCRTVGRAWKTREAIEFVERLWTSGIPKIAIENPIGCLPTFSCLMKPAQIIQPYNFGHNASKQTCLWLKGLNPLRATGYIEPREVKGKKLWGNQTDSGQNKLTPSETRSMERSRTYQGIADAMAEQWGKA